MELGIPRNEMNEMNDDEVIRKWVIGLELADRRKKAMEKATGGK